MHIVMIECNPNGVAGIANALGLGHKVTLISADPDFYRAANPIANEAFAHANCEVITSDTAFDIPELEKLVREVDSRNPVDGIMTYSEYHTVHAASIAAALGLPGMSVEGALNARHKHRTRLVLADTEVPQPAFAHVSDPAQIQAAIGKIGFPCVVKPSDGTASLHVLHIKDERDLNDYLRNLAQVDDYGRGVVRVPDILLEEFIEGEIVSVEACVLAGGEVVNLGVTDRVLSGFPYFIEMGVTYFGGHPLEKELFEMNEKVLRGLGIDFGFIHAEYILSANGPVLCEVNGRLTGGMVPALMKISSGGVDPYLEVIRQALGEKPELPFPGQTVASGRWFGSPVTGTIKALDFSKLEDQEGFHEALGYRAVGRPVNKLSTSNFDWLGHVIFTGAGRDEAAWRSEAALDRIQLEVSVEVAR